MAMLKAMGQSRNVARRTSLASDQRSYEKIYNGVKFFLEENFFETCCHLQQIFVVGFSVSLSKVHCKSFRVIQESFRSHSGVTQELLRSQSEVSQIWRADLESFPNLES